MNAAAVKTGSPTKAPPRAGRKTSARAKPPAGKSTGQAGGKKLVIVESPAKAKTINRYLGPDFIVKSSMGHVRDLPTKDIGVDLEGDFTPTYEPLTGRKKLLTELRKFSKTAPEVFLATDLDREGEAIAWHLAEALKIPKDRLRRVVFNEITKSAIQAAFADPRKLDMNKVDAQQARRILDRIVGYKISPLLWKKVARGLSAGRVQTVAVRLIVERERAIEAFMPEEFWKIPTVFTPDCQAAGELVRNWVAFLARKDHKGKGPTQQQQQTFIAEHGAFRAELLKWKGEKFTPDNADAAIEVAQALGLVIDDVQRTEDPDGKGPAKHLVSVTGRLGESVPAYLIRSLKQRENRPRPPAPFTTVALQQAASVRLGFSTSRTMRLAQQLYEGIDVPGSGSVGLITYMRTDSRNLSVEAVTQCRSFINESFGEKYLPKEPKLYSSGGRAQEAHEAIRPTDVTRTPESLAGVLDQAQLKLYDLIWRRFVACQMAPALWEVTEAEITTETPIGKAIFKAVGRRLIFDGFLKVAGLPKYGEQILPPLSENAPVAPVGVSPTQHFTQPPPRYTEASLVKALEAEGIGRPSTYAAIVKTIQDREYVKQIERRFHATELGMVVTDKLIKHFADIFDLRFTARLEDKLDDVEEARADWVTVLRDFYGPFKADLEKAGEEMVHAKAEVEPSDYTCPQCDKPMVYRWSKNGKYLACTGYPDCKTTFPVDKDGKKIEAKHVDIACPVCGKGLIMRRGRFGPFMSCPDYPDCKGIVNLDKKGGVKFPSAPPLATDLVCSKCGKPMNLRRGARGPWLGCSAFPKCRGRLGWKTLKPDQQKALELQLLNHEKANPQPVIRKTDGTTVEAGYIPQVNNETKS
ncbi:MAG: type I DNA topoisomerase [Phycisphaerae bacterium]|nr:type I DNA topoisomerase [Phycisphaerae bacterium]